MTTSSLAKLEPIFRSVFDLDTLTLRREMTAHDVDGWDSLTNVLLIAAIEENLGVSFKASEITKLNNVGELADLLEAKLARLAG